MYNIEIVTPILIVANILFSYRGLTNHPFFERHKFQVEKILVAKEYKRLLTSGFLHVNWLHLFFNMFALFTFGSGVEAALGTFPFLLIYFSSLIGGGLLSLAFHRHHPGYSSAGASGAICGVIFAFIALAPNAHIGLFFLPISFPSWVYGLGFVIFSIYGIRSNSQNIGHDAHLGGALIGMIVALFVQPAALVYNYIPILAVIIPTALFIFFIITKPRALLVDSYFFNTNTPFYTIDDRYNSRKAQQQHDIDLILEKINRKGLASLSKSEQAKLDDYSRSAR